MPDGRRAFPVSAEQVETGGSIEESAKANVALAAVFPAMAVVMLALLMIQLQSFSRLALVFVTAPLGIIGATGALLLSNKPSVSWPFSASSRLPG